MKTQDPRHPLFLRVPVLLLSHFVWLFSSAGSEFQKDMEIRLTKDSPLYFKAQESRAGKSGEQFKVLQYDPVKKRVYILSTGQDGKPIALNVPEEAIEPVPSNLEQVASDVQILCAGAKYAEAQAEVAKAILQSPDRSILKELQSSLALLISAKESVDKATLAARVIVQRVKQLEANADVAARPNHLDRRDVTGVARATSMRAEANDLRRQAASEKQTADSQMRNAQEALARFIRGDFSIAIRKQQEQSVHLASKLDLKQKENVNESVASAQTSPETQPVQRETNVKVVRTVETDTIAAPGAIPDTNEAAIPSTPEAGKVRVTAFGSSPSGALQPKPESREQTLSRNQPEEAQSPEDHHILSPDQPSPPPVDPASSVEQPETAKNVFPPSTPVPSGREASPSSRSGGTPPSTFAAYVIQVVQVIGLTLKSWRSFVGKPPIGLFWILLAIITFTAAGFARKTLSLKVSRARVRSSSEGLTECDFHDEPMKPGEAADQPTNAPQAESAPSIQKGPALGDRAKAVATSAVKQAGHFLRSAGKVSQQYALLAALKAKIQMLKTVDLNAAYYALGKSAYEAKALGVEFADQVKQIDQLQEQILARSNAAVKEENETGVEWLKRSGEEAVRIVDVKRLSMKLKELLAALGRSVAESTIPDDKWKTEAEAIAKLRETIRSTEHSADALNGAIAHGPIRRHGRSLALVIIVLALGLFAWELVPARHPIAPQSQSGPAILGSSIASPSRDRGSLQSNPTEIKEVLPDSLQQLIKEQNLSLKQCDSVPSNMVGIWTLPTSIIPLRVTRTHPANFVLAVEKDGHLILPLLGDHPTKSELVRLWRNGNDFYFEWNSVMSLAMFIRVGKAGSLETRLVQPWDHNSEISEPMSKALEDKVPISSAVYRHIGRRYPELVSLYKREMASKRYAVDDGAAEFATGWLLTEKALVVQDWKRSLDKIATFPPKMQQIILAENRAFMLDASIRTFAATGVTPFIERFDLYRDLFGEEFTERKLRNYYNDIEHNCDYDFFHAVRPLQ